MAERRMIHKNVICSDAFIVMSFEAQALYFQLQIEGDEYGFVSAPLKVARTIGASEDAITELINAGFVIRFDSGIVLLRHWDIANTRKNDRENPVAFPKEYAQVYRDEDKIYQLLESNGIQSIPKDSQRSLGYPSVAQRSEAEIIINSSSGECDREGTDEDTIMLATDIFDNEKMVKIDMMPERDSILIVWLKLICLIGRSSDPINAMLPYNAEELSTIIRIPLNKVTEALSALEGFDMVEVTTEGVKINGGGSLWA